MSIPFVIPSIDRPCNEVRAAIRQALALAGLPTLETFDLQAARLRTADCSCPRHHSNSCECQMVVLLVYAGSVTPATLILYGSEGETSLTMPDDIARPVDERAAALIEQTVRGLIAARGPK